MVEAPVKVGNGDSSSVAVETRHAHVHVHAKTCTQLNACKHKHVPKISHVLGQKATGAHSCVAHLFSAQTQPKPLPMHLLLHCSSCTIQQLDCKFGNLCCNLLGHTPSLLCEHSMSTCHKHARTYTHTHAHKHTCKLSHTDIHTHTYTHIHKHSCCLPGSSGGSSGSGGGEGKGSNGKGGGGDNHPMQLWTYLFAGLVAGERSLT